MVWSSTLGGNLDDHQTSFHVIDRSGVTPLPFALVIDPTGDTEVVLVRSIERDGSLSVERGAYGSTRQSHAGGVTVEAYEPGTTTAYHLPTLVDALRPYFLEPD